MFLEVNILGVFANYNLFSWGLAGAIIFYFFFLILTYTLIRVYEKDSFEKSLEVTAPVFLIGFVLTWINFNPILVGLGVLITFLISMKHYLGLERKEGFYIAFEIIALFWVFGNSGIFVIPLFLVFLIYNFVESERIIRKRNKEAKDKDKKNEKSEKEDKKKKKD
jgi:hypothetical protein